MVKAKHLKANDLLVSIKGGNTYRYTGDFIPATPTNDEIVYVIESKSGKYTARFSEDLTALDTF